jgi:hypothetical protein
VLLVLLVQLLLIDQKNFRNLMLAQIVDYSKLIKLEMIILHL